MELVFRMMNGRFPASDFLSRLNKRRFLNTSVVTLTWGISTNYKDFGTNFQNSYCSPTGFAPACSDFERYYQTVTPLLQKRI